MSGKKKKVKQISFKKRILISYNALFASLLIIIIIIVGAKITTSNFDTQNKKVHLNADNYKDFFNISIQGKLMDVVGRDNEYFDTVIIIGNINSLKDGLKCDDVGFSLLMNVGYDNVNGASVSEEIEKKIKLDDNCKYKFEIKKELKAIGKNPIYSYKLAGLDGSILINSDES